MDLYSDDHDQYPKFSAYIQERFNSVVGSGSPLFTTDAEDLFSVFLDNLPAEARQHYNCHACRHFVNRYGGLLAIFEGGEFTPVMWEESGTPEFFRRAVAEMRIAAIKAKVTGVFIPADSVLGQPVAGGWEHMSVTVPQGMVNRSVVKTAGQLMAEKREDNRILNSALQEYSGAVVDQALTLLRSETMYRSNKVLGVAEWFKALRDKLEVAKGSRTKANVKWLAVATAPAGFCHVKQTMIGTLLDDLAAGYSIDVVSRRFADKMDPLHYMRPQAAPAQGNIQQAEKIVAQMGITDSLRRRYAKFEEIPEFLWQDSGPARAAAAAKTPGSVFAGITPKGARSPRPEVMTLPSTVMTWEKFHRTILPAAETIEAQMDNPSRFMALVTAVDPTAPNILRWDNVFSWYYRRGGSYRNWNMPAAGFVKVKGIIKSPNAWGDAIPHSGHQVFFLLEGCRDISGTNGGGFFPEMLKSDLHGIRSTLEAYNANTPVEDADSATACGIGYSKDSRGNLTFKVTANNSTQLITIDRWD